MGRIDLHLHSIYSDGEDTIEELLIKLRSAGVDIFSITDHDNIASHPVLETCSGITYIPGVEMSCVHDDIKLHLLGYGIEKDGGIYHMCEDIKSKKRELIKEIVASLIARGYRFDKKDLEMLFSMNDKALTKVDIARLLVKYGEASSVNEAYNTILAPYKIGSKVRAEASVVSSLIKEDNGICILAHPGDIEKKYGIDILDILDDLRKIGIDGIEVFNSKHTPEDVVRFLKIAKERSLLITGGSDYHGMINKPNIRIGEGIKDGEISEKVLKKAIQR